VELRTGFGVSLLHMLEDRGEYFSNRIHGHLNGRRFCLRVTLRIGDMPQLVVLEVKFKRGTMSEVGVVGYSNPLSVESVAHEELAASISLVLLRRKQPRVSSELLASISDWLD